MKDGGTAFPTLDNAGHGLSLREHGMSLRDWFAGQALAGIITLRPNTADEAAWAAYEAADAMLAAREVDNDGA